MNKVIKILVIRLSSIGDIVLTTPVLRCLKQQLPGAEIHFCTKQTNHAVLKNNPYVNHHHFLESDIYSLVHRLQAENFDYVIDLHNNFRTTLLKIALNTRSLTVDKLNWRKWIYVRFKINWMPARHLVTRYLATVSPLGVRDDGDGLDFFVDPVDHVAVDHLPLLHQSGYIAYAIGGQYATKRLPVQRMIELCRKIDGPVVLLGGSEDRVSGQQVTEAIGERMIYNACGLYNLAQSASLLQQSRVVFSHDTGLMHIAAAFKKTVYSIWGNTTPQLGMYPYRTPYVVLEKTGLGCRPCSKIGFDRCPADHFKCMNELPFAFNVNDLSQPLLQL